MKSFPYPLQRGGKCHHCTKPIPYGAPTYAKHDHVYCSHKCVNVNSTGRVHAEDSLHQ